MSKMMCCNLIEKKKKAHHKNMIYGGLFIPEFLQNALLRPLIISKILAVIKL